VVDVHGAWPEEIPRPRILLRIGSAMAFGTGDHATTASCLRLLLAEAAEAGGAWSALDIGTGSGILAVAAEKLGADSVTAFDNDPRAVRAARANLRVNRCLKVNLGEGDITRWQPGRRRHRVVMANLFSGLLVAGAPRIVRALAPGGGLILSGILRSQEADVLAVFQAAGLASERTLRRGKWVALLLRAPGR
jgi:ribosomal protein L11 methyltransferase